MHISRIAITGLKASLATLLLSVSLAGANNVWVEAESFSDHGGWVNDTQFVDCMGSPYLLAHGMGVPVADATTSIVLPAGTWRVWVRTRDWTPDYDGEKPGRFQVTIDGTALPTILGIAPAEWGWADAGTFEHPTAGSVALGLHDLTGFEGRCDALCLTDDLTAPAPPAGGETLAAWRAEIRGESTDPETTVEADLVVVGGGLAGISAAIAAAEEGLDVILIQDRPFLGGNASGEIRVKPQGEVRHRIVRALGNAKENGNAHAHVDDTNRLNAVAACPSIDCRTGWRAYGVVTNAAREILAVDARHVETGARTRFVAPLFVDATGDGWLGFWAGAAYRMGRESKDEYGESLAQTVADTCTMGNSMLWSTVAHDTVQPFPEVPWATVVSKSKSATSGDWTWEAGLGDDENTIYDAEALRDRLFRAVYGSFSTARSKNADNQKRSLQWVPFNAGKRESRRIIGDYVVKQGDVENSVWFEDAIGTATWSIDLHFYKDTSGFIAGTKQVAVDRWYMPYRAICCRDVPNLFLAGRCASFTHVAMGSSRVMNTGGQMGVAAGYAASLCRKYGCLPRDIYRSAAKTVELQALIGGTWPARTEVGEMAVPTNGSGSGTTTPDAIIVDNTDSAHTVSSGSWTVSTSASAGAFYGSNYLVNKCASSDTTATCNAVTWFAFRPALPQSGRYIVDLYWNASANRATNVCVIVSAADGVHTNRVDMTQGGGSFSALGIWSFDPEATPVPEVRLCSEDALGTTAGKAFITADAVRLTLVQEGGGSGGSSTPSDPNNLIVEESDAERSEPDGFAWIWSTSSMLRSGDGYYHSNKNADDDFWMLYRPTIPETKAYRLQQVWNGNESRDAAAKVEVRYADETTPVVRMVDQTRDSGHWMTLGVWRFAEGTNNYARLLTAGSANKYVIADAFRWKHIPGETIVDNADATGVEFSGTWSASSYNPTRYGANYVHNGKTASANQWVRFTPTITTDATYRVSLVWNASSDRGNAVQVEVVHADGSEIVPVDMTVAANDWTPIGTWRFQTGNAGSVRILTEGSAGKTVIADAVLFTPVDVVAEADSDGNGLPDDWEREHFLHLTGTDPDADPDLDGFCNYGEWLAGTDPNDGASLFHTQSIFVGEDSGDGGGPRVTLSWPSVEGRHYAVLRAETPGDPFEIYATDIAATPPENVVQLPTDDADSAFYKIKVLDP